MIKRNNSKYLTLKKLLLAPAPCSLPRSALFVHNRNSLWSFWLHLVYSCPNDTLIIQYGWLWCPCSQHLTSLLTNKPTWACFLNSDVSSDSLRTADWWGERLRWRGFSGRALYLCVSLLDPLESHKTQRGPSWKQDLCLKPHRTHDTRMYTLFSSVRHTLLLRQVYKILNWKHFYAGENPWAYLPSKDTFCGQLEDESQREDAIKQGREKKREWERSCRSTFLHLQLAEGGQQDGFVKSCICSFMSVVF